MGLSASLHSAQSFRWTGAHYDEGPGPGYRDSIRPNKALDVRQPSYEESLVLMSVSSAALKGSVDFKIGSRHEPATGTHKCPRSAIANGGMVLYCAGVFSPLQCIEKNDMPLVRSPATWPNVLHPINKPSAWIMQDIAFCTSGPTCSVMGLLSTLNTPVLCGLQNFPARFSGQSSGIFASKHSESCKRIPVPDTGQIEHRWR